jgi:hypothetical protein
VANFFQVKARHEGIGCGPLRADHHVVSRLVPEIITKLDTAHRVFPTADNLELLVELQIAAGGIPLSVAEHGNDDVRAEAVHCVWCRQIGPGLDLCARYDLVQGRVAGIGTAIDNMQVGRAHTGHDQISPLRARIAMARRARVPAHMMKLIANTRHLQTRNHLAVGRTLRVGIDGAQIVRLLNARAGVNGDCIEQLFARCLHRLGGRSITRSTAVFGHRYFPKLNRSLASPKPTTEEF